MADTDNLTRNYTYEKKPRSVSQLSQFDKCPFSWKLSRHERVWKRPAAWLQQGTGVHAVAEKYMLSKLAGSPLTRDECYEIFKAEYADGINEATEETPNLSWWFASGPYRGADDIERRWGIGLQQVDKTLDWIDNHPSLEVWHTPGGTPGIELAIEFELDGIEIRGYIDAVLVLDGEVLVVDYKGLDLDTKLPTPDGWTTMRDVQVGDTVFAHDGTPTKVVVKSQPKRIGTYVVTFDDGAQITCDSEHIWWTQVGDEPASAKGIDEVIRTLRNSTGHRSPAHRVPVAGVLELPEADLPVNPYVLGCWLGDGKHTTGEITKDRELFDLIELEGESLGKPHIDPRTGVITRTVLGLKKGLQELGLIRNKHVPGSYLRASHKQRLALLQGLMDTDGNWNKVRRTANYTSVSKTLAEGVLELLRTLGQRPRINKIEGFGFGKPVTSYRVEFTPVDVIPFRHPRKLGAFFETGVGNTIRSTRRLITAVEPGPDVETACIGVDHPSHTYLCGERMIPTHNTGLKPGDDFQLAVYALALKQLYGVEITRGVYFMAKTGKPTYPYDLTDWTREKISARFHDMERKLEAGDFTPKPGASCARCDVALSCEYSMA
ncbi:Cas4 family exonuclease [Mycobacterium phage Traft412]|nr:Cas4 family exonuclease [Mycobacterium phage Traft412]